MTAPIGPPRRLSVAEQLMNGSVDLSDPIFLARQFMADATRSQVLPPNSGPAPMTVGAAPARNVSEVGATNRRALMGAIGEGPANAAIKATQLFATLGGGEEVGKLLGAIRDKDAKQAVASGVLTALGALPIAGFPRRARAAERSFAAFKLGAPVMRIADRMEAAGMAEEAANLRAFMKGSVVKRSQYHFTNSEFDVPRTPSEGFHVGSPEQAAHRSRGSAYNIENQPFDKGRTLQTAVSIKNPVQLRDYGDWDVNSAYNDLVNRGIVDPGDFPGRVSWESLKADLADHGYDGIVYANTVEGLGNSAMLNQGLTSGPSYAVFSPNQIKSILGNRTFDAKNPSIYAALAGLSLAPLAGRKTKAGTP